jgi:hypothetical protein
MLTLPLKKMLLAESAEGAPEREVQATVEE